MSYSLKRLTSFIIPVLLFLAGCTKAIISVQLKNPSGGKIATGAVSSTRENFAAAAGVASLPLNNTKIKFTVGYTITGQYTDTNGYRIRSTSAGVADEQ